VGGSSITAEDCAVPDLSADSLHLAALAAFRAGNRARLEFIRTLRTLAETRLFIPLGFPSIVAYALRFFGSSRTETFEAVRVATALDSLPAIERSFARGEISWSALRHIARIAASSTEREWVAFAAGRTADEVRAEVDQAIAAGTDRPRERRFGLPDLKVRVVLDMTRSEHEVLRAALERVGGEVREPLGGAPLAVKDALLYLAERVLASPPELPLPAVPGARSGEPARMILYHVCPECRRGGLDTPEGRVEVPSATIDRIEGDARREEIALEEERGDPGEDAAETPLGDDLDRPTPPALRRRILLRDGARCANPVCRSPAEHCHHIIHRSRGGRTALWNETSVCGRCHALIHAGLLTVAGDPSVGLRWRARGEGLALGPNSDGEGWEEESVLAESARADSAVAIGAAVTESGRADCTPALAPRPPTPRVESERPDSVSGRRLRSLVRGLVRLGEGADEARERIEDAIARLAELGVEPTDENILQEALCPKGARWRSRAPQEVAEARTDQGRRIESSMNTGVPSARVVLTM